MDLVIQGYCCQLEMPGLPQCKSLLPGLFFKNQTITIKMYSRQKRKYKQTKNGGKIYLCFKAFVFATHTYLNSATVKDQTMKFQVKEGF